MRPELLFPLFKSAESLKGVGPRMMGLLRKLTGEHVIDLVWHLPSGIVTRQKIDHLLPDYVTGQVIVTVTTRKHHPSRSRRVPYKIDCDVNGEALTLTFFNGREDYLKQKLPLDKQRIVAGKLEEYGGVYQITHPDHILDVNDHADISIHEPVYPLTGGITNNMLGKAIQQALSFVPVLPEWQDPTLITREKWIDWKTAVMTVHNPTGEKDLEPESLPRQRLAYDELFANQLALELARRSMKRKKGRSLPSNGTLTEAVIDLLPFALTGAQRRAISEISADLTANYRMLRLVQGDVGSGKTMVALMTILQALENGAQAALMAPTEILARQHLEGLDPYFKQLGLKTTLLTGRLKGKKRAAVLQELAEGTIHVAIGTHALFQEDVQYHDLGLAVIDEQHRFGVHQRLALSAKGKPETGGVDVLVMTATPIPRTLALTAYGDMDVSIIDEKPPGRKPVDTRAIEIERLDALATGLGRKIAENERIYWVCPLVEESEVSDLAAAEDRKTYLEALYPGQVGIVHGKLKSDEKEAAMEAFKSGETQILVATTVIEVGVDVPEATVMIIEHAERFGLAQLHQLRGRVGRGGLAGNCLLLYAGPLGETQKARLKIMRETEDGFVIAEEDLRLRGAGELLGTRQSGLPEFKIAELEKCGHLVTIARDDARLFLEKDPELQSKRGNAVRTLLYLFERDSAIHYLRSG
ncbi:ATP-dependent DNA helicase RecG [Sneathiella aquimaris]|uniref:ATP-dependent DNA helicase RecG n=1 Tax=Sneathiella aquimaris TaxID=2599305 RepID=UPI00146A0DAD|nr:ATP-dependent DNA helicase RecG [Sneathiella aquimaris]